jgi:transposase
MTQTSDLGRPLLLDHPVVGPVGAVGNPAPGGAFADDDALAGRVVQAVVGAVGGLPDLEEVAHPVGPSTASTSASGSTGEGRAGATEALGVGGGVAAGRPVAAEEIMHSLLTRHAVQVLLGAGHTYPEVAGATEVSARTVRRIAKEPPVEDVDDHAERQRRLVGRPSKAEPFRAFVADLLKQEPDLKSLEVLRRARLKDYEGEKSAMYKLIASIRGVRPDFVMRFEGLPGEFSQHDFGQVRVRFLDGSEKVVHFFASRLKWSRWTEVTLVEDECAETLVRTLLVHFLAFGGVPLCAVFDRPKTVALQWKSDGTVTEWNPLFAYAAMEIGFTAEVCWPHQPRQKGSAENEVGWVKGSFFKQRRFQDMDDLRTQLAEWLRQVNHERPSRATGIVPAVRREEELPRLRSPRVLPQDLALRIPVSVGPTAMVTLDTNRYAMPAEAAGVPGTLFLYENHVRIVAGRHEATHPRLVGRNQVSLLPEHRASHLAAVSGRRGRQYLKRQHLFDTGEAAVAFLTELVHQDPRGWYPEVDRLHDLLQLHGPDAMNRAFRVAVDVDIIRSDYVAHCLGAGQQPLFHAVEAYA